MWRSGILPSFRFDVIENAGLSSSDPTLTLDRLPTRGGNSAEICGRKLLKVAGFTPQRPRQFLSHHEFIRITLFVLQRKAWQSGQHLLHLARGLVFRKDRFHSRGCRGSRNISFLPCACSYLLGQASIKFYFHWISLL
jgi:hypothetical protein